MDSSSSSSSHEYFSKSHGDINLSKEEMEFLEKQFFKYLTTEMEKDSWKDFYDILKDEQNKGSREDEKPSTSSKQSDEKEASNHTKGSNGNGGFKVNPERTKQQYKHGSSSFNAHSKWGNSQQQQNFQQNQNTFQRKESSTANSKPSSNNNPQNTFSSKEKKENKKQNKKSKSKKTTTKHRQQQHSSTSSNESPQSDKQVEVKGAASIFAIVKNLCIIFGCFVLMIVMFLLKIIWLVLATILKCALLVFIYAFCKLKEVWSRLNEKFEISKKIVRCGCSVVDIFALVTGINIKALFTRKRNKNVSDVEEDNTPIVFPENAEEAIKLLLLQKDSSPYRTLCVQKIATHDEIKANYRKLARLVHPDKCELKDADEAFKVLDTAFKKISDPEKRGEVDEEIAKEHAWQQFNKSMGEEYKKMFDDIVNSLSCSSCNKRHKKNLIKDRTFYEARYCGDCNVRHPANEGDVWIEENMLGLNWCCYACFDGEVFEITEWGKCQNLKGKIPANFHKIVCRLGGHTSKEYSEGPWRRKSKKARKQKK